MVSRIELRSPSPLETDVFVIGGGPAGLAIAIAARQRGFSVQVADGANPPIDKACGEGLLPDGVAALEQLGIRIPLEDARPFCGIRFLSADKSAEARFTGTTSGLAIRRLTLHKILMNRAEQMGTTLLWRTSVSGVSRLGVHLGDRIVKARWIVGADGANSRVRRWAGLERGLPVRLRYAFRQHFRIAPWSDYMEVHWGKRCQGYAASVGPDQVCVALASHDSTLRLEERVQELPSLRDHLKGAEILSTERGALTGNRQYRHIWRENIALIGDASGTVDAITGEGLGLAFSQAVALANSFQTGDLREYERAHRRLVRRPLWMARLLLTLDRRPMLQYRTLQVFRQHPEIFRSLLEFHMGRRPPLEVVKDGLMFGWGLLTT